MPRPQPRRRFRALAPLIQPDLPPADAEAAEDAFAQLRSVLEAALPAWEDEPDTVFDPGAAFAARPALPWPRDPSGAVREETAGGGPAPGPLEVDLGAVAGGTATARDIADAYRARIAALQPRLNAFITVCAPEEAQALGGGGGRAPLRGAALAVKDIVETAGVRTTGGSLLRADHVPARDAECWGRLRAAGALLLGKTNTHEFAAGTTNENEAHGPARNPFDPGRVPGGSSGGSAAAVAAGMAAAALGTDTGGSVRIPAACCGVVGLKPTYGRISRRGVFALSWSLDHVGPIARTVRDAALLFAAMSGADPADAATLCQPPPPGAAALGRPRPGGLRGLRVGVPDGWLDCQGADAAATGGVPVSDDVRGAFARALETMAEQGADVVGCDLGSPDFATGVNRVIALPESAAYHAPYLDGSLSRYGGRVRARLLAGRFVFAEEYLQAQRLRASLGRRYAAALGEAGGVHLVATPTLPVVAPRIGAAAAEGLALLRFCAPFNVVGWPALTLPCGRSPEGMPIGLQLAAAPYREAELLAAAAVVEAALGEDARPRPAL